MRLRILAAVVLLGVNAGAQAQLPPGGISRLNSNTHKYFGEHQQFSATMVMTAKGASPEESISMPGKLTYSDGKSRYEIDLTLMKGGAAQGEMSGEQMKTMGIDKLVAISRPDKQVSYVIYPGLKSYVVQSLKPNERVEGEKTEVKTTELGKESLDGHPCIKRKQVITDESGRSEAIVWNAPALRNFPLKMEMTESGTTLTLLYKNLKFGKPADTLFDAPEDYAKYDSMQAMLQAVMMKRLGPGTPQGPGR